MQNTNNTLYINTQKVIDIRSEILFRESEDDLYFSKKINSAYKKLNKALKLTPLHLKSIMLLADVCFIKGYTKKALELSLKADKISPDCPKITASICNCLYSLKKYEEALKYCQKAIILLHGENDILLHRLIELKIDILINLKQYKSAFFAAKEIKSTENINKYEFLFEKIKLQKKLKRSNLKIV